MSGTCSANDSARGASPRRAARAWSISPTCTLRPGDASPASGAMRPRISPSSVDLPAPFGPVIPMRSPPSTCSDTGPSVNPPRVTVASRSVATTALERGACPMVKASSHSLRGSSTSSRRAMRLSIWRTFWPCFSLDSTDALRRILSLSGDFRIALRTPWDDHSRCVRARETRSAFVSANCSYASRACRRATWRSSRNASYPPSYTRTLSCARSSSTTVVTQRARNSRSCETSTTPPRRPRTKDSRRASPSRSRWVVGSSRSTTSKRLSSRAARATRAAWPPERPAVGSDGSRSRPSSASVTGRRSSRSAAPLAIQRSSAVPYASSAPGRPSPRATAVRSSSAEASAQPVRRAT